jgi:hypothetical protein
MRSREWLDVLMVCVACFVVAWFSFLLAPGSEEKQMIPVYIKVSASSSDAARQNAAALSGITLNEHLPPVQICNGIWLFSGSAQAGFELYSDAVVTIEPKRRSRSHRGDDPEARCRWNAEQFGRHSKAE